MFVNLPNQREVRINKIVPSVAQPRWRDDGMCGYYYHLPDGTPAQCDPYGDKPCCSGRSLNSRCGNTAEYCSCTDCTDYRILYKDWRESGGTLKWRYDGKCGDRHLLPDGTPAQCDPDGDKPCCSHDWNGICGNTTEHCTCAYCTDYGRIQREWRESNGTQKWIYDGRCGRGFSLPDGTLAQCDPDGDKPCCSSRWYGVCGNTKKDCICRHCLNYNLLKQWKESGNELKWRYDGRCGYSSPLPDGTPAQCDPDGDKPCCRDDWNGSCGNTTEHCTCTYCTDYRGIYRYWRESKGTQKWRYDGRCGSAYPLPDGTPAQCDPDGDKPCCSRGRRGECGNTTDHCTCRQCTDYKYLKDWEESGLRWRYDGRCGINFPLPDGTLSECDPDGENLCCDIRTGRCGNASVSDCVDYRRIYREWRESNGTQKWRYIGQCGSRHPLPDGTPVECNPDGYNPCCNVHGLCGGRISDCLCSDCVDYRLVRAIRASGENCIITELETGFMKNVCFDETTKRQFFKCAHSDIYYQNSLLSFSEVCENDEHDYQACGFISESATTNTDVLCGGYICERKKDALHKFIKCTGDDCTAEIRNCMTTPDPHDVDSTLCDDKCEYNFHCRDESNCNGYKYGINCTWRGGDYVPVSWVCDGREDCYDKRDEQNCTVTNRTDSTCTHSIRRANVPILNYTRCSVFDTNENVYPYCQDFLDQTNCSDIERVGGYCKINGSMTTVSKFIICKDLYNHDAEAPIKLCDDNLQNRCVTPTTNSDCRVHKHRMCDGVMDCPDGSDEIHDMCEKMTTLICKRSFATRSGKIGIPVSWIMDKETDCMNGQDEDSQKWEFCKGNFLRISTPFDICGNVFKCPGNDKTFVRLNQLCDGVDSCGNGREDKVCRIARDSPEINRSAQFCMLNRKTVCLDYNSHNCKIREFRRPWGDVFGEQMLELSVPLSKVNCDNLFGEYYLFLSCMDLCIEAEARCPLIGESRRLKHNSCPGQYPNRVYTLANNSFLTFVVKSDSGHYHQNFYQCDNRRCIEYKQVCDLVDDCGDMSDEINCANHMICEGTLSSSKHQLISQSQVCDGIYDCFDLSDECNEFCGRNILGDWTLKCICWFMGLLAFAFNGVSVIKGIASLNGLATKTSSLFILFNKTLVCLICFGDLLMGIYLVILSFYDSLILKDSYCRLQPEWLTGTVCLILGVLSTVGSQISVFAMTALSVIRAAAFIGKSMTYPIRIGRKASFYACIISVIIISISVVIALIPLLPFLEDYFVQGVYYDPAYKLFVGFPNKKRHIEVLKAYYRNVTRGNTSDLSWREIGEMVDGMFTQDYGNLARLPVHFYGNDGVCLFKYFVRTDDARRSRQSSGGVSEMDDLVVWTILIVNLACFVVMSLSYIALLIHRKVNFVSSSIRNTRWKLQTKVTIILVTDFLCWVPLILVSILHNLGKIDASSWYVPFTMVLLPLNSVINPLIYENSIKNFIQRMFLLVWEGMLGLGEMVTRRLGTRISSQTVIEEYELDVFEQNF